MSELKQHELQIILIDNNEISQFFTKIKAKRVFNDFVPNTALNGYETQPNSLATRNDSLLQLRRHQGIDASINYKMLHIFATLNCVV